MYDGMRAVGTAASNPNPDPNPNPNPSPAPNPSHAPNPSPSPSPNPSPNQASDITVYNAGRQGGILTLTLTRPVASLCITRGYP